MPEFNGQTLYSFNTDCLKHTIKEKIHFQWHSNYLKFDVADNKVFPAEEIHESTQESQEIFPN